MLALIIRVTVLDFQMWDALLKVECSIEEVSSRWTQSLTKDLRKRISTVSDCMWFSVKIDIITA